MSYHRSMGVRWGRGAREMLLGPPRVRSMTALTAGVLPKVCGRRRPSHVPGQNRREALGGAPGSAGQAAFPPRTTDRRTRKLALTGTASRETGRSLQNPCPCAEAMPRKAPALGPGAARSKEKHPFCLRPPENQVCQQLVPEAHALLELGGRRRSGPGASVLLQDTGCF